MLLFSFICWGWYVSELFHIQKKKLIFHQTCLNFHSTSELQAQLSWWTGLVQSEAFWPSLFLQAPDWRGSGQQLWILNTLHHQMRTCEAALLVVNNAKPTVTQQFWFTLNSCLILSQPTAEWVDVQGEGMSSGKYCTSQWWVLPPFPNVLCSTSDGCINTVCSTWGRENSEPDLRTPAECWQDPADGEPQPGCRASHRATMSLCNPEI